MVLVVYLCDGQVYTAFSTFMTFDMKALFLRYLLQYFFASQLFFPCPIHALRKGIRRIHAGTSGCPTDAAKITPCQSRSTPYILIMLFQHFIETCLKENHSKDGFTCIFMLCNRVCSGYNFHIPFRVYFVELILGPKEPPLSAHALFLQHAFERQRLRNSSQRVRFIVGLKLLCEIYLHINIACLCGFCLLGASLNFHNH